MRTAGGTGRFRAATTSSSSHYDWPALVAYFEALVAGCHGANWHEAAERLARYGWWEFEDYTP